MEDNKSSVGVVVLCGIFLLGLISFVGWFLGSNNVATPAGYVGYVTQGSIMGKKTFVGTQQGPTSTGKIWLVDAINVSVTPYTFNEEFSGDTAVQSKDNLKVAFSVHLIWQIKGDRVQEFMDKYSTLESSDKTDDIVEAAYKNFLQQRLRTLARAAVEKYAALDAKDNIDLIGSQIEKQVQDICSSTPFAVSSVVVGNIQPPKQITDSIEIKLAKQQEMEQQEYENQIASKQKQRKVIDAEGVSEAMRIINGTLTPAYLQHEAIEAQKGMVNSPNHTVIYIPVGNNGVPLVGTFDTTMAQPTSQPIK